MKLSPKESALQRFVDDWRQVPVVWGVSDCSAWAARWVETITGRAPVLPSYTSRDEAHALIAAAGGLGPLWDDALGAIGVYTTSAPVLGDVIVCDTRKFGTVGLVMAHGGVAFWRAESGVHALAPRKILRAWHVE